MKLKYFLTLVTLGQYAPIWIYQMAGQAQMTGPARARDRRIFVALYSILLVYIAYGTYSFIVLDRFLLVETPVLSYVAFAISVALVYLMTKWLFLVANHVRSSREELPSNIKLMLLLCLGALALPLIQSRLDRVSS